MMASPDTKPEKRICIGKITSAHGVKGLVKILPLCDDTSLLNGTLFTDEQGDKTLTITLKNVVGKHILAQIDGITTPEDAKTLKYSLFIPRESLPEINNQNEFYIEDLTGLSVLNEKDESIGTIQTIQNFGAGDLLEIKPPSGASYYLPFQDEYVMDIDLENSTVKTRNTEQFIL